MPRARNLGTCCPRDEVWQQPARNPREASRRLPGASVVGTGPLSLAGTQSEVIPPFTIHPRVPAPGPHKARGRGRPHPASPAHTPDLSGYLTEMELRVCAQPHTQTILCMARVLPLCARVHMCVHTHRLAHTHTRTPALGIAMNRGGWAVLMVTLSIQGRETRVRRAPWASAWTRGIAYHRREKRNLPEQRR